MTPCQLAHWHLRMSWNGSISRQHPHLTAALDVIRWRGKRPQRREAKRLLAIIEGKWP